MPEVVDNSVFNPIKRKRRLEAFNVSNKCKKIDEDNHSAVRRYNLLLSQNLSALSIFFIILKDLSGEDEEENSGPFQCGICSKTFSESVSLSRHLKQFHQVILYVKYSSRLGLSNCLSILTIMPLTFRIFLPTESIALLSNVLHCQGNW